MPDSEGENMGNSYIFFGTDVAETRGNLVEGIDLPGLTGTDFGVFGFRPDGTDIFDRYIGGSNSTFDSVARQYRTGYNTAFSYDILALWHSGEHVFYAYYPYNSSKNIITAAGTDAQGRPYIAYTQPSTLQTMADVMTASADATSADGEVKLGFRHRLFALDVVLTNCQTESEQDLVVKSADIIFANIAATAYLYYENVLTGTAFPDIQVNSYSSPGHILKTGSEDMILSASSSHNFNNGNSFLLIPCASLKAKVTITLVDAWGEERTFEVDCSTSGSALTPSGGFVAGSRYVLAINKSDKGFDFAWKKEDWASKNVDLEFN